ncbi:hypothetical protein ACFFWD_28475 [Bradyrhizobium erythrophlei]|uniref:hypothetical protein n=1 Tax=Bradyrhizobium erythrophlei TaxID=1437360 RepID=UPI0035EE80CB
MWIVAHPAGHFAAGVTSSVVFTAWMACIEIIGPIGQQAGLLNVMGHALSVWPHILGGALLLMSLPWCLVAWLSGRLHYSGPAYFAVSAAVGAFFVLGTLGGILPGRGHPTFLEGFELAVETSGLAVFVSGFIGGLTYWLCSEGNDGLKRT